MKLFSQDPGAAFCSTSPQGQDAFLRWYSPRSLFRPGKGLRQENPGFDAWFHLVYHQPLNPACKPDFTLSLAGVNVQSLKMSGRKPSSKGKYPGHTTISWNWANHLYITWACFFCCQCMRQFDSPTILVVWSGRAPHAYTRLHLKIVKISLQLFSSTKRGAIFLPLNWLRNIPLATVTSRT